MTIEELKSMPKWAGIYYFKNDINGKYYIGQAIMLRKRLLHHISNYNNNRYDAPLYKAFNKYGLNNFSVGILEEFKTGYSKEELKNILDNREKYYIEKYNSYGNTGYNQTKGGDSGVLGYKMTEEQVQHLSKNSKSYLNDGRNMVYCYDIKDKCTYISVSLVALGTILNTKFTTSQIRYGIVKTRYILSRSKEDLECKINSLEDRLNNSSSYKLEFTEELFKDINSLSYKEFMIKYNVCKKTYYNYKNRVSSLNSY